LLFAQVLCKCSYYYFTVIPCQYFRVDTIKTDLASNLARLMAVSEDLKTQMALAKRSGVAQTTISNYLRPASYEGAPQLDKIEKLAKAFGLEAWHLIHPTMGDREFNRRELDLYRKLRDMLVTSR